MPSTATSAGHHARRIIWLGVATILMVVLWTIGWFVLADRTEKHLPDLLHRITGPQAQADCANADVKGYPFRFGLFCDTITYESSKTAIKADVGAFRSAAQFYRPNHIVFEMDGPLTLTGPGGEGHIDWQSLQASMHVTTTGLGRGSVEGKNVNMDIDYAGLPQKFGLKAAHLIAHSRQNGPDLDFAAYGENIGIDFPLDLNASAIAIETTLPNQAALHDMPFHSPAPPLDIRIHRIRIELDENTSLEIAGQIQLDVNRQLSGQLTLTTRNQERLADLAARLDPEIGKLASRIAPTLSTFDTVAGDDAVTLPLAIRKGAISMGIIPLGQLPAF